MVTEAVGTTDERGGRRVVQAVLAAMLLCLGLATARLTPAWGTRLALARLERRGDSLFQQGNMPHAELLWCTVLEEHARAVTARNKLAVLYMRGGRFTAAQRLLEDGVALAPGTVSFHFNLGLARYMQNDYDGALAALTTVERMHPGHGKVHYLRGVIYDALGEHTRARGEFIRELNLDPATPAAWTRLKGGPATPVELCGWEIPGVSR